MGDIEILQSEIKLAKIGYKISNILLLIGTVGSIFVITAYEVTLGLVYSSCVMLALGVLLSVLTRRHIESVEQVLREIRWRDSEKRKDYKKL